ncbi:MAG: S1C family serine protease [Lachnospiraceae bacterium]|nr:S1C family serine protease [Lachnospiraceae bacterium]
MTSFMREHIKKKPFYKKRWFAKTIVTIFLGVVFGMVFAVSFSMTFPWAQKNFGTPEVYESNRETTDETAWSEITQSTVQQSTGEKENFRMDLQDYKDVYEQIHDVAREAFSGMLMVSGVSSGTDLFREVYENEKKASGMIVSITDSEIWLVTERRILKDAERAIVTLNDDSICDAKIEKTDDISGLAVLTVSTDELREDQIKSMRVLKFGTTQNLQQAEPVIAVGSPLATSNSIASGVVTSIVDTPVMDGSYKIVNTDITGSTEGNGILLNMDGEVVGVLTQKFGGNVQARIRAISSDDVSEIVRELISKTEKVMLGITGRTVNETISEELDMPQGMYVTAVTTDSPAMLNGIQCGDIVVAIKNNKIENQKDYQNVLKQCTIGEEIPIRIMRKVRDGYSEMEIKVRLEKKQ